MINTKLYLFVQSVEVMGLDLYEKNAPIVTGRNINYFFFYECWLKKNMSSKLLLYRLQSIHP
jgi:hypothetical protein